MSEEYELKFDPKTIEHLGVKMYSTLPPALAELISNAYDADANEVKLQFHEQNGKPVSITVIDDGYGMSSNDIQDRFLVIGRNRRSADGDIPSPRFGRLPTGKKGLGKLALFGLAEKITVDSTKDNLRNRFSLDWNQLLNADGTYSPETELRDEKRERASNTIIKLSNLKRKTAFDLEGLADSLSRIFIVDDNFKIILQHTNGKKIIISNNRRYAQIKSEFEWGKDYFENEVNEYFGEIEFKFITSETPISPSSGLRGITIFSRGKLVNSPEFFSNSTSSHFFQYLTGWISADFIDLLDEDVISTNRQSINWDNSNMVEFREYLSELISKVNSSWRQKRKDKKENKFKDSTGINQGEWFSKLPDDIRKSAKKIVDSLSDDEGVSETFVPVIEALHKIIPEYPMLHWRHLHEKIRPRIEGYYQNAQYGEAADQGTKIYAQIIREMTNKNVDGTDVAKVFGAGNAQSPIIPDIEIADLTTETGRNIQAGQCAMTRGVMQGFRNPVNHSPIDVVVPQTFSELDCLNILSLISYLATRLDNAKVKSDNVDIAE